MEEKSESLVCPRCGDELSTRVLGEIHVHQCPQGHGIFLERADLGNLVDGEQEWHRGAGHHTQPMPRITADMTAPPPVPTRAQAYVATLFD